MPDELARLARERPECLESLTERERMVFWSRVPEGATPPQTLAAVAGRLGVTRERVRQIEAQALRKVDRWRRYDERRCTHCGGRGWV